MSVFKFVDRNHHASCLCWDLICEYISNVAEMLELCSAFVVTNVRNNCCEIFCEMY